MSIKSINDVSNILVFFIIIIITKIECWPVFKKDLGPFFDITLKENNTLFYFNPVTATILVPPPGTEPLKAQQLPRETVGAILSVSAATGAVKAAVLGYGPVVQHLISAAKWVRKIEFSLTLYALTGRIRPVLPKFPFKKKKGSSKKFPKTTEKRIHVVKG